MKVGGGGGDGVGGLQLATRQCDSEVLKGLPDWTRSTSSHTHTSNLEFQLTQLSQWEKGDGTARWKGPETCRCFKKVVSVCRKRTARCESAAKLKLQKTPRGLGEET